MGFNCIIWCGYRAGSSESRAKVAVHCDWTLTHWKKLEWLNSGAVERPALSHFPRLRDLTLANEIATSSTMQWSRWSNFAVRCLAKHLHPESLHCTYSPIAELPALSRFPRLKQLHLERSENLTSFTIRGPFTPSGIGRNFSRHFLA